MDRHVLCWQRVIRIQLVSCGKFIDLASVTCARAGRDGNGRSQARLSLVLGSGVQPILGSWTRYTRNRMQVRPSLTIIAQRMRVVVPHGILRECSAGRIDLFMEPVASQAGSPDLPEGPKRRTRQPIVQMVNAQGVVDSPNCHVAINMTATAAVLDMPRVLDKASTYATLAVAVCILQVRVGDLGCIATKFSIARRLTSWWPCRAKAIVYLTLPFACNAPRFDPAAARCVPCSFGCSGSS